MTFIGFFISPDIGYYEGDCRNSFDLIVPQRPSPDHNWNGIQWIAPDLVAITEADAVKYLSNGSKTNRFVLGLFYLIDQRMRILEAKPAITKAQFLNGIKQLYKDS